MPTEAIEDYGTCSGEGSPDRATASSTIGDLLEVRTHPVAPGGGAAGYDPRGMDINIPHRSCLSWKAPAVAAAFSRSGNALRELPAPAGERPSCGRGVAVLGIGTGVGPPGRGTPSVAAAATHVLFQNAGHRHDRRSFLIGGSPARTRSASSAGVLRPVRRTAFQCSTASVSPRIGPFGLLLHRTMSL